MNQNSRTIEAALKAAACVFSAFGATYLVSFLADQFHWVAKPYDPNGMGTMIALAAIIGAIGVWTKRIGLVALFAAIAAIGYCLWTISLGPSNDWEKFVPVIGCLAGFPLANALILRLMLFAFAPTYGQGEMEGSLGHSLAAAPTLGRFGGPLGTVTPTPPIESPGSSSHSSSHESKEETVADGNQF